MLHKKTMSPKTVKLAISLIQMKKSTKNIILDIIGIFLLILGIISISNSMYYQNPTQVLFMCYIGLMIIGIGILIKRTFLIMSQVYILTIPHIVWTIDFLYQQIFNKPLWGITDYFFIDNFLVLEKIISLQHIFTIPLAIYAVILIGLKRRDAWKLSLIQITIIYVLVTLLTLSETNINCVFSPCINVHIGLPYRLTWFVVLFLMTFITSILLNKFIIPKKRKK